MAVGVEDILDKDDGKRVRKVMMEFRRAARSPYLSNLLALGYSISPRWDSALNPLFDVVFGCRRQGSKDFVGETVSVEGSQIRDQRNVFGGGMNVFWGKNP